jgi:hypothetical protein
MELNCYCESDSNVWYSENSSKTKIALKLINQVSTSNFMQNKINS